MAVAAAALQGRLVAANLAVTSCLGPGCINCCEATPLIYCAANTAVYYEML